MASKAFQDITTLIADTFTKGSKEAKAFGKFFAGGLNVNTNRAEATIVSDSANWTKLGNKCREQWNKK